MINLIEQSDIDVLNIEKGNFKLYYQKPHAKVLDFPKNHLLNMQPEHENAISPLDEVQDFTPTLDGTQQTEENIHYITSPSIGTFYSRRAPDEEPLVQIGSIIKKDDPVCVLEAMKLMNEVTSDVSGKVIEILVEEGQVIEYNQPLFKVNIGDDHA